MWLHRGRGPEVSVGVAALVRGGATLGGGGHGQGQANVPQPLPCAVQGIGTRNRGTNHGSDAWG